MKLKPEEYLKRAVNASPIFKILWEQAVMLLPPVDPEGGSNVEVFFSASDLSDAMDGARTVSNLRNELTWLQNWGWIKTRKGTSRRYLGRRTPDGTFYLLADLAAKDATGEARLVSRVLLGIQRQDLPEVTAEATTRMRMGAARQWTGDPNARSGGSLDQLMGS